MAIGAPVARRGRRRRIPLAAVAIAALIALGVWALSVRLLAATPDPYGVGASALAQLRRQYPRSVPLSVRVAHTRLGWIGVSEGVALLNGERVPQATLRSDGYIVISSFGPGHGLWIVETAVVYNAAWRQLAPGPPPPWPYLLPFGVDRPLMGSFH